MSAEITRRVGSASEPSEWALRELPARVATFLHTVGAQAPIRALLESGGYGPADHQEGLELLGAACAYRSGGLDLTEDEPARQAERTVHDWARRHLRRLRTGILRLHPEAEALFRGLEPVASPRAVLAVSALLERLDALAREEHDSPVLATLARRGLDAQLRQRLQQLVRTAQAARAVDTTKTTADNAPAGGGADDADDDLVALYDWYEDWVLTARTLVRRKDWLLRLGVTRRRGTSG